MVGRVQQMRLLLIMGVGCTVAISPTNASRCWKKGDLGAVWDDWVVERVAMMLVNRDVILVEVFLEFEMQGKSRCGKC